MECLASFVLIVLLPLTLASIFLAWRSRAAARELRDELALLRVKIESLGSSPREPASSARAAAAPQDAAAEPATAVARPATVDAETATLPRIEAQPATKAVMAAAAAAPLDDATAAAEQPAASAPATAPASVAPRPVAPPPSLAPKRPRASLEQRLGAQLFVWIGGIAFVLAAAFFFKFSVDRGWIGPQVRVTLGALFGIALLVGGEVLRKPALRISQALSAAGV